MTAHHHPSALPKRHRIEEYEIVRVLGAGGFGITYLAFDHQLDGPVAIKEYFPAAVATRIDGSRVAAALSENREVFTWGLVRFIDEARSIHRFHHPNVVRAHRYVETHDTAYIVMEYIEGASLEEILNQWGSLSAPEWRRWLNPLLNGLAHMHGHGYLHRDIKPTNIVIRATDSEPVLIDFGAARVAARKQTHTRVLTPAYAPIEQHSTHAVESPATDIYALAAVSYRVLTGAPPPDAPDRMLDDRYKPLSTRAVNADRTWLAAIDRGLRPRPEHRPQTVAAWRALMEANDDPAGTDPEPVAPELPTGPAPSTPLHQLSLYELLGASAPSEVAASAASPFSQNSRPSDDHRGPALSDEQYERAKPHFQKAWAHMRDAGADLAEFVDWLLDVLVGRFNVELEAAANVAKRFMREQIAEDNDGGQPAAKLGGRADAGTGAPDTGGGTAARPLDRDDAERGEAGAARPGEPGCRRATADSTGETSRPATGNPPLATETKPDSARRDARPWQFEIDSPLTLRTIAYGGAHAVPMVGWDWPDGYVDLMKDCYLHTGDEPEWSLPEQEESHLMVFYSLYSALKYGDHGFDRIVDEVLARLRDEDDHDTHESWWRDGEFREIVGQQVRGLERCGDDRTEVREYINLVEDWTAQYQDLRDEPGEQMDSDLLESVEALVSESEASAASVAERLSASAAWFDEWAKSDYAVDEFVECMRQLRLLHENQFEAARMRVERAIPEITG